VAAGNPVVQLLPPENMEVRFFVPETVVGKLKVGESVASAMRRLCFPQSAAAITFISPQCEYTPPVIYSNENRSKLVFMIIAKPPDEKAAAASRPARGGDGRMTTAANPEYAIDVQGLNKHYGDKHVVRDVSLRVRKGEIFGFLGPNGSGKTTTIRMVCGLLKPDSGSGTCLGYDIVRDRAEIKRKVGYMTQRFSFWDDLSIAENLDFVARMYEIPERKAAVRSVAGQSGPAARANQLAGALSGGWKQRMALAACMLHEPNLLLLDEPTAGVDPRAGATSGMSCRAWRRRASRCW
jgi:ABC-type branched-subunit amino acid transport system ATPase component